MKVFNSWVMVYQNKHTFTKEVGLLKETMHCYSTLRWSHIVTCLIKSLAINWVSKWTNILQSKVSHYVHKELQYTESRHRMVIHKPFRNLCENQSKSTIKMESNCLNWIFLTKYIMLHVTHDMGKLFKLLALQTCISQSIITCIYSQVSKSHDHAVLASCNMSHILLVV